MAVAQLPPPKTANLLLSFIDIKVTFSKKWGNVGRFFEVSK
jgi:hypothetical protein